MENNSAEEPVKAKDKLILVFYVNITKLEFDMGTNEYLQKFRNQISQAIDDSILAFIFPIMEGKTRLECVNPRTLNDEEYDRFIDLFDYHQDQLNKTIKELDKDLKEHSNPKIEPTKKTLWQKIKFW